MRLAFSISVLLLVATSAGAQTGKHFAIGAGIGVSAYPDRDFRQKNPGVAFAYRITPKPDAPDGWRWALKTDLGYSNRSTTAEIGGTRTTLGKLRVAQVMAGIQRSLRHRPWQAGLGVVAGPSFNHFSVDGAARDAYVARLGTTLDGITVKNSLVVKPECSVWYNLSPWFAVQGALSYTVNRPKAETKSGGVTTTSTWKTDHASASVSLVVGIY